MNSVSNVNYKVKTKKKQYKQLTYKERVKIEHMINDQLEEDGKINCSKIAKKLGRNRSTIWREIKKNKEIVVTNVTKMYCINKKQKNINVKYISDNAQYKAEEKRMRKANARKKLANDEKLRKEVNRLLVEKKKSPDVVAHLINEDPTINATISANTIYDGIRQELLEVKVKDRKRMKSNSRRIKENIRKPVPESKKERSIELRPDYINNREEFGHFEMDLVLGKRGLNKNCLLTLTERLTRYEIIIKLKNKTSEEVLRAIKDMYKHLGNYSSEIFKSITTDNGSEFSCYEDIEKVLVTSVYFCHPGASYEKGTNERHNGMIREYIPKGSDISEYDAEYLDYVADRMNDLERKVLNYHSPSMKVLEEYDSIEGTELLFELQHAVNQ